MGLLMGKYRNGENPIGKTVKSKKGQDVKSSKITRKRAIPKEKSTPLQRQRKREGRPLVNKQTIIPKKNQKKKGKKKRTSKNTRTYRLLHLSIFGYSMFFIELIIYWLLTKDIELFLEKVINPPIREPYLSTVIGFLFILPLHTYLKGNDYSFKAVILIGFFFIVRNIVDVLFSFMV